MKTARKRFSGTFSKLKLLLNWSCGLKSIVGLACSQNIDIIKLHLSVPFPEYLYEMQVPLSEDALKQYLFHTNLSRRKSQFYKYMKLNSIQKQAYLPAYQAGSHKSQKLCTKSSFWSFLYLYRLILLYLLSLT